MSKKVIDPSKVVNLDEITLYETVVDSSGQEYYKSLSSNCNLCRAPIYELTPVNVPIIRITPFFVKLVEKQF